MMQPATLLKQIKPYVLGWLKRASGSCFGNDIGWTQAGAAQNTWYSVADADMADASGGLYQVAHAHSGKLTVLKPTRYGVLIAASVECSALNKHIQIGIAVNGTVVDCTPHYEVQTPNAQLTLNTHTIVSLAAGDTVEAAIRTTDTGTPDLAVDHLAITIWEV